MSNATEKAPRTAYTSLPLSPRDIALAMESSRALAPFVRDGGTKLSPMIYVTEQSWDPPVAVTVPGTAFSLFVYILKTMANGYVVSVVADEQPHASQKPQELTTGQIAELLNVSRPYVVKLLESGAIPFHKVGTRRRVRADDAIAYKQTLDARRDRAFAALVREGQEMGLGY